MSRRKIEGKMVSEDLTLSEREAAILTEIQGLAKRLIGRQIAGGIPPGRPGRAQQPASESEKQASDSFAESMPDLDHAFQILSQSCDVNRLATTFDSVGNLEEVRSAWHMARRIEWQAEDFLLA